MNPSPTPSRGEGDYSAYGAPTVSKATIGLSLPGAIDPEKGLVKFSPNVKAMAGQYVVEDFKKHFGRDLRMANDAGCFTLSESVDGAGAGLETVYGVILGTGVGGSLAINGKLLNGANHLHEWGHVPLPFADDHDHTVQCGCGRMGCVESYLSGPALHRQLRAALGRDLTSDELASAITSQDAQVMKVMDAYCTRLAKAFAMLVLILDPDAIVLGGGLSNLDILYHEVPKRIGRYTVVSDVKTKILKAKFGDDSGQRGAAWLWG